MGASAFALMLRQEIFVWESFVESKHLRWTSAIFPVPYCHHYGRQRQVGQKRGDAPHRGPRCRAETFRKIGNFCKESGVEYLTVYAFSTENWKRPQEEVDAIMGLLQKYLNEVIRDAQKTGFASNSWEILSP